MTDLIPAELLEKGAAYIEEHGLWQGDFWPGAGGFVTFGEMQRAVAAGLPVCASGALTIARGDGENAWEALGPLARSLGVEEVPGWNDDPGRTAAEVADAMRACASGLRGAP